MQLIIQSVVSFIIFCPFILLCIVFFFAKKLGLKNYKAFGYGADVATVVLFFSIPLAIKGLWDVQVFGYILLILMAVAIVVSYQEWRTKKEIQIMLVLRKLWRLYFLLLSFIYIVVLIVGLVMTLLEFSKS